MRLEVLILSSVVLGVALVVCLTYAPMTEKSKLVIAARVGPDLLLQEARALFHSKERQRRAAQEGDVIAWLCDRINGLPNYHHPILKIVKLTNRQAATLRGALLCALSEVIVEAGIVKDSVSTLTPAVQCALAVFRHCNLGQEQYALVSVVATKLVGVKAQGLDAMLVEALNCFARLNVAPIELVALVAAITGELCGKHAWAYSNKYGVQEALRKALERPETKRTAILAIKNMSTLDLEDYSVCTASLKTIFDPNLLENYKDIVQVEEIFQCAFSVCSNCYQNTQDIADANLPRCIMDVVAAPFSDISTIFDEESLFCIRILGLEVLAALATMGPAARASFRNPEIALLLQVVRDVEPDIAREATNVLQKLYQVPRVIAQDSGICSICIEEWAVKATLAQLSCGHAFHPTCIHSWVVRSTSCPVCRSHIVPDTATGK
jgi:hypothetical protein